MQSINQLTRLLPLVALGVSVSGCAVMETGAGFRPAPFTHAPSRYPTSVAQVLPRGAEVATDGEPHRTGVYQPPTWGQETTERAGLVTFLVMGDDYPCCFDHFYATSELHILPHVYLGVRRRVEDCWLGGNGVWPGYPVLQADPKW